MCSWAASREVLLAVIPLGLAVLAVLFVLTQLGRSRLVEPPAPTGAAAGPPEIVFADPASGPITDPHAINVITPRARPAPGDQTPVGATSSSLPPFSASPSGPRPQEIALRDVKPGTCSGSGAKLSVMASEADCMVVVGSVALGAAPFYKKDCPSGDCVIEVSCPSGRKAEKAFRLRPGDYLELLPTSLF